MKQIFKKITPSKEYFFKKAWVLLLSFFLYSSIVFAEDAVSLKIASFPFKPLIFQDSQGEVHGFNADLINRISAKNGWKIDYIHGSWNDGLEGARQRKIDLMTSVMYTKERDEYLDYNKEPVFVVWGEVYALPEGNIPGLFALDGQTVALMRGDLSGKNFQELAGKFDIDCKYLIVQSHDQVFNAVKNKKAFAGVAPNVFGLVNSSNYQLVRTSIVFGPNPLYFASPQGTNQNILDAIDRQLRSWKKDKTSYYYESLNRWLFPGQPFGSSFPVWMKYSLAISTGLLLLFVIWSRLLAVAVKSKTKELSDTLEKLRVEKENYKLLADHTHDWEYWLTPDNTYRYVSPACERISGYKTEEFISNPNFMSDIVIAEHQSKMKAHFLDENKEIPNCVIEFQIKTKDLRKIWIEHHCLPVYDDQGTFCGRRGSNKDITKRKLNEIHLIESEQRFRELFNNMSSGVAIYYTNDNGNNFYFKDMNEAGLKFSQKELAEVIDKEVREVFPGVESLGLFEILKKVYSTGQTESHPTHVYRDDKLEMYVENYVCKLPSGELVAIFQDTTNKVKSDEEKRVLQKRIQQAQKMESIGNLAGGIAHDFNNILFPIVGLAEMLLEDLPDNSLEKESANEILKAGQRAAGLVKQILTFSRQDEHEFFPTQLQSVLKEVLKLTRASIPKNIEITQSLQPDCGLVLADPIQLHQIGMNLITNAYYAVKDRGGKISVAVQEIEVSTGFFNHSDLAPGRYATLTVTDDGPGIPEENLDKIFDPYFTTKKKGKGTGLGLSVVYGIVKEYSGEIKVTSALGKGTSFQVYLPVMSEPLTIEKDSKNSIVLNGSERILLVDDEVPIVNLEKQILERLGYTVTTLATSSDALDAFRNNPDNYDLIITDMSMPQMTGDKLAQEILKIRSDIPIIICTGFSESVSQEEALSMGIKGFLTKPVVKADIAKEVRRVLEI